MRYDEEKELIFLLEQIEDPRHARGIRYRFADLLLICIYAVGYMKAYHHHHTEYRNRTGFFLSMLFLFLGAMFGLVLSGNLVWMYFFWEITSVPSC